MKAGALSLGGIKPSSLRSRLKHLRKRTMSGYSASEAQNLITFQVREMVTR